MQSWCHGTKWKKKKLYFEGLGLHSLASGINLPHSQLSTHVSAMKGGCVPGGNLEE